MSVSDVVGASVPGSAMPILVSVTVIVCDTAPEALAMIGMARVASLVVTLPVSLPPESVRPSGSVPAAA